ncbi:MAG: bifunctional hydroxymethylpyrimidine kinase/phosphomethylpyrimidine kinase [Burkholderiales bacterium]
MTAPPVVWSVAGTDSGGGAGLSADQRAADAFGVHLCPVVATVTAQNSQAVTHIQSMSPALIDAQLQALANDMPPRVIKTGLLCGAEQVRVVARWVDRMREAAPVALVVDPVLTASTGAGFADDATLQAYRDALLPRATFITPNHREAVRLLGLSAPDRASIEPASLPALARALRETGAQAVCITGGDSDDVDGLVMDWVSSLNAEGWLALPRVATANQHGTGCTFASSVAAALARGFVSADAAVLAKMATAQALRHARAAGQGAGPVLAHSDFAADPSLLPQMSWGEAPVFAARGSAAFRRLDLYAIVDNADRVQQVLDAGVRTVQLRMKTPQRPEAGWQRYLADAIQRSVTACRTAGAELFVNDHWELAYELGASGVHLGQEDLVGLGEAGRQMLQATGMGLGISSHSLWELCRARSLSPRYVACGPVWPTTTKAMPWRDQGTHNLAWWRHMAQTPVVAIGGILQPAQVHAAAACGVDGVCVVRALGNDPAQSVPTFERALLSGRAEASSHCFPQWPNPTLDSD